MEWEEQQPKEGFWEPETNGDMVIGVILNIEDVKFGNDDSKCYHLEVAPGRVVKTRSHKSLVERLWNAKVGDKVRITYKGTRKTKSGDMNIYKVEKGKAVNDGTAKGFGNFPKIGFPKIS